MGQRMRHSLGFPFVVRLIDPLQFSVSAVPLLSGMEEGQSMPFSYTPKLHKKHDKGMFKAKIAAILRRPLGGSGVNQKRIAEIR